MSNPVTISAPEGLPFIEISREIDHPVELVFRAYREPDLFRRWLGPRGYEMDLVEYDFRTGGSWHYVHELDGERYGFRGVFHTVREEEFALQTFEFEGYPDVVALESLTFTRLDGGRTRLDIHSVYPTVESRDGMVASGMETGVTEGYEQLDELLEELAAG
ncbi:SRPBCC family protein [Schumannella luteola]|uniref:Uncharacterized protein YndB with AHSA1/START domain n=1 Tax=Schumannella luteola TaxID=472059 RepID=A0A852YB22_9MICO|nr:SRPBCC family protein [Schumannella luteola]NYG99733.1 uncharacterized protein YndB with AHSA1/START domain [Schumannella luteola]TPX06512.1 polyketide cyclase [Schumannella luteola]